MNLELLRQKAAERKEAQQAKLAEQLINSEAYLDLVNLEADV